MRLGLIALVLYLLLQIDFLAIASSILFGAYFAAAWLARSALSGLRLALSTQQQRTRSGESIDARLQLQNANRYLPIFYPAISVREKGDFPAQVFQYPGIVPPKKQIELNIDPSLKTRGIRQLEAFAPRSNFPFALHQAQAELISLSSEIMVWPKPDPIDLQALLHDPPRFRYQTSGEQSTLAPSIEATRIRDYHAGDPRHSINWKLSAKLDKLTVIEARDERQERYELHLETSTSLWPSALAFERMLRLVSALVSELSRRKLVQGITIDDAHYPLTSHQALISFFDALATAQPARLSPDDTPPAHRKHLRILPAPHSQIMLVPQATLLLESEASK